MNISICKTSVPDGFQERHGLERRQPRRLSWWASDSWWDHHWWWKLRWKHIGSPKTDKSKATISTKKVTFFCDWKGSIQINYLSQVTTMNGKCYANLLTLGVNQRDASRQTSRWCCLPSGLCSSSYCNGSCQGTWIWASIPFSFLQDLASCDYHLCSNFSFNKDQECPCLAQNLLISPHNTIFSDKQNNYFWYIFIDK